MPVIALVLFVVSAVIFLLAAVGVTSPRANLVAGGLCIFTAAVICQAVITTNIVH